MVPRKYEANTTTLPQLGKWVDTQRSNKRKNMLLQYQIDNLNEIDFEFEPIGDQWNNKFECLLDYRNVQGHVNFPPNYKNKVYKKHGIRDWVHSQKRQHVLGRLKIDRKQQLENVGIIFPTDEELATTATEQELDFTKISNMKLRVTDKKQLQQFLQSRNVSITNDDNGTPLNKDELLASIKTLGSSSSFAPQTRGVADSEASGSEDMSTKIDCPNNNDVLFRRGYAYLSHPGNAMFRGLVEKNYHQHSTAITTNGKGAVKWSIVNEVERQGRFLVWDPNGYWTQLRDRTLIGTKVNYALKGQKRRIKAKANHQVNHSSTSVFQQVAATDYKNKTLKQKKQTTILQNNTVEHEGDHADDISVVAV